jgi:ribosomal protein L34E
VSTPETQSKRTPWRKQPFNTTINHPTKTKQTLTNKESRVLLAERKEKGQRCQRMEQPLNGVFETPSRVLKQTKFDM